MSISFIIPIWEKTSQEEIYNSLDSLSYDSNLIDEILIIFDGIDSSKLENIFEIDLKNKIRLIYLGKNRGPGNARNIGVLFSKSEYIFLLDAGDVNNPGRVKSQLNDLKNYGVSYGQIEYTYGSKKYTSKFFGMKTAKKFLPFRNPFPNGTLAIKKKLYMRLKGFPILRTAEDWVFVGKLLKHLDFVPFSKKVYIISDICSADGNMISRRHGFKILLRIIRAHYLMFSMDLYSRFIFPFAILYQIILRLLPYQIFKLIYKFRLIFLFNNENSNSL